MLIISHIYKICYERIRNFNFLRLAPPLFSGSTLHNVILLSSVYREEYIYIICGKDKDDKYYTICYDIAIMTPLMEIAGFDKVGFNPIPIYVYRLHPQNDHVVNGRLQKQIEIEIFAKESFKQIF